MQREFPSIKQPEGSISCGAYSLTACLHVMDLLPVTRPIILNRLDMALERFTSFEVVLQPTDSIIETAEKIYQVTGVVDEADSSQFVAGSGLNSIGAMAYVFECFGVTAEIIIRDLDTFERLTKSYPQELRICQALGIKIALWNDESMLLDERTCLLPSALFNGKNIHVVATKHDGVWFDPERDSRPSWPCLDKWDLVPEGKLGHEWLGVALMVRKTQ